MTKVQQFLINHRQSPSQTDLAEMTKAVFAEIEKGLSEPCSMPMIPTYIGEINNVAVGSKRLLIDAGGTNFRSALGYFDDSGKAVVKKIDRKKMPGTNGRLTKQQFYGQFAENVKHLLSETGDVGLCFSYNVAMGPDIDGTVNVISKEVDAPEVVGTKVGECTLAALKQIDSINRRIVVLNDTVASLLGGWANTLGQYGSYIGFIFGTGSNVCYIEKTQNIKKLADAASFGEKMIINMEAGGFDKFVRGDFDLQAANATANPNRQLLEKVTSGRYLGDLIKLTLAAYANEKLFCNEVNLCDFNLKDVTEFLENKQGVLYNCFCSDGDRADAKEICSAAIERAAKLWGIFCGAVAARCGQVCGKPVAIVAEGTTFKRLAGFRQSFENYVAETLKPYGVDFKVIEGEELNLVGTLMATMAIK